MKSKKSGLAVGVDLGGTNVRAGLVDSKKILKLEAKNVRSMGSEEDVFADVCSVIDEVWDKRVRSLGIGVPSLVNPKNGVIFDTVNIPSWKNVPLKKKLEKRYKVEVRIDNDANCFALGEKRFGSAKHVDNFVGLVIGTGLGAGIVSGGQLHSGMFCGAGEFGMIPYRDSILEHYASGQFFRRQDRDGAELAKLAKAGDPQAQAIFNDFGQHIAHAIQIILYSLAPEMIVLGGSVSQSLPFFSSSMRTALTSFGYPDVVKSLQFKASRLKDVSVLGAASLS